MKILVTGAEGMVGSAVLPELSARGHALVPADLRPTQPATLALDVRDAAAVARAIAAARPDRVIHLAAETDVDRCEQDPRHAYDSNAVATEHLVAACRRAGARLLYVSTAAVFDGRKPTAYVETDAPEPVNVYGRTKLAGEYAVRRAAGPFQIVRASWMVGGLERDKKFVAKILQLLETRHELTVVTDKIGSLTFTNNLARGIATLLETDHAGIFHMANHGTCSRYQVAEKIVELLGRTDVTIRPVTSDAFPLPAPRPDSEALENRHLWELGLDVMPGWEAALADYVHRYLATRQTIH
jgi:dTDP-4-dehydrorhamnose reductase